MKPTLAFAAAAFVVVASLPTVSRAKTPDTYRDRATRILDKIDISGCNTSRERRTAGAGTARITIAPNGEVASVAIVPPLRAVSAGEAQCVGARYRTVVFPAPGSQFVLDYAFTLK